MIKHQSFETFDRSAPLHRQKLSFSSATVKDLTAWTITVNTMHMGDRSAALLGAMIELAELDCTEILRFNLLQVLHPSIEHILKALEHHFIHNNQSYTDRQNHVIELHTSLQLSIVHLYIDICYRSHQQLGQIKPQIFQINSKKALKTTRLLACYYALQQLSLLMLQQQKRYIATFTDQWRHTHALYSLALQNHEQLLNINQLQGTHYPIANIQQAYIQILLIEIFNRFQIRPIEIEALFQCSFEWVKWVELSTSPTPSSRYMLDTRLDHPPQGIKNLDQNSPDLFMSTQALLEHINLIIQHNNKVMSKTELNVLTTALQFHVQNVLGSRHAERRYQRHSYHAELEIAFDVKTTYFYLSQQLALQELQQKNLKLPASQQHKVQDPLTATTVVGQEFIQAAFEAELDREAIQLYLAQVLDMSAGGYRLHWKLESSNKLHSGQFIQLREQGHEHWKVGIIRWIKSSMMKTYAVGIEVLANHVLPCQLQCLKNQATDFSTAAMPDHETMNAPIQALLLLHDKTHSACLSVVVDDVHRLNQHQHYQLTLMQHQVTVLVTETMLVTHSCTQYQCQVLSMDQFEQLQGLIEQIFKGTHSAHASAE